MDIRIAGTVNDSIVDGPGFRYSIFTQGCPHNCPGCHNPETHPMDGGKIADTNDLINEFTENILLDGITLSGGDPFMQPIECAVLAKAAHENNLTVWCYTGYTIDELINENEPARMELLNNIDVLVDGPFILKERSLEIKFRGSKNQRLVDVQKTLSSGTVVTIE